MGHHSPFPPSSITHFWLNPSTQHQTGAVALLDVSHPHQSIATPPRGPPPTRRGHPEGPRWVLPIRFASQGAGSSGCGGRGATGLGGRASRAGTESRLASASEGLAQEGRGWHAGWHAPVGAGQTRGPVPVPRHRRKYRFWEAAPVLGFSLQTRRGTLPSQRSSPGGEKSATPASPTPTHPGASLPGRHPWGKARHGAAEAGGGWKSAAAGEKKIYKKYIYKINQKAEVVSHLHATERKGPLREQTAGEEGRRRAGRIKRHGVTTPALKIGSGPATVIFTRNALRLSTSTPLPGRMAPTAPARSARGQS